MAEEQRLCEGKRMKSESIKELASANGNRFLESRLVPQVINQLRPLARRNQHTCPPLVTRFFEKVAYGMSDCWYWRGCTDGLGYGHMTALGEVRAHRVAWRLFNGDPRDKMVLHKCDVRNCVNPGHLFLGTQTDNMRDCAAKGRNKNVPQPGELNPMAVLTSEKVRKMRAAREGSGRSYSLIAKDFGVSTMTAYRAIVGQSWREV
jgi:HNH endonuclease